MAITLELRRRVGQCRNDEGSGLGAWSVAVALASLGSDASAGVTDEAPAGLGVVRGTGRITAVTLAKAKKRKRRRGAGSGGKADTRATTPGRR